MSSEAAFPDYVIILRYSKPDRPSEYVPLLGFHAVAFALLAVSGLWWAGLLWYAGLVTTFMMSFRLRLWLEHQGTPETHRLHLNFWQAPLLAPHNSWMHWEHHSWPTVPYHRLAKATAHPGKACPETRRAPPVVREANHMASGQVVTAREPRTTLRSGLILLPTPLQRDRSASLRFFGHSCINQKKHLKVALSLPCEKYSGRLVWPVTILGLILTTEGIPMT